MFTALIALAAVSVHDPDPELHPAISNSGPLEVRKVLLPSQEVSGACSTHNVEQAAGQRTEPEQMEASDTCALAGTHASFRKTQSRHAGSQLKLKLQRPLDGSGPCMKKSVPHGGEVLRTGLSSRTLHCVYCLHAELSHDRLLGLPPQNVDPCALIQHRNIPRTRHWSSCTSHVQSARRCESLTHTLLPGSETTLATPDPPNQ